MADRIGVINKGEIILVEDKNVLMEKLGKKQLTLELQSSLDTIPVELNGYNLELINNGNELVFTFDSREENTGIAGLIKQLNEKGIEFKNINSSQSSLEEIFVSLVSDKQ